MATRRARATRSRTRRRSPGGSRRRTIFFEPKNQKLAELITIVSPDAFRESIRKVQRMGIGAREKRALVLAQNRARAMLKKRSLSAKERSQFEEIAQIRLPPVTERQPRGARQQNGRRQRGTARTRRAA
jgi:hypothetical protein